MFLYSSYVIIFYGELEETSDSELQQIVSSARNDKIWANINIKKRVEIISKLIDLLEKNKEAIAHVMANEMGKPLKAGKHEIEIAKKRVIDYCDMIPEFIKDEILFEDNKEKNIMTFSPLGVVAVISPWNSPVFVPLAMIIPPLLCGNNVLWKPSEYTSFTGLKLAELFSNLKKAGLPENAFQIVIGGKDAGKKIVENNIDMVALTGSIRAGKEVMKASAGKLHKFVLELGGKDPAIILEDAELDKTAHEIVKSSTMYTGQVCFGVERVYCHENIYDKFVERVTEKTKKLVAGNPLDEKTDIGPFAVKFQMEKVLSHIDDALSKGARLLYGGKRIGDKGYFMAPGVIVNVNHNMKIMQEETFGPITPVMKFKDVEEAIKLANDSIYGLTASIWTTDLKKGEEIARKIEAGTVEINRHGMSKAGCPWGGCKQSGIGRIYSKEGVREFCNIKHVWVVK
ncbi:aldehyde dehydrogenase family protein [Candidatus Pacearchaeota archaeon]|nr:aldehyde dehydrogenase family protein [Candidatus Pacearchaeota archaeon]